MTFTQVVEDARLALALAVASFAGDQAQVADLIRQASELSETARRITMEAAGLTWGRQ